MNSVRMLRSAWHEMAPRSIDGKPPPHDLDAERKAIDAMLSVAGFVDRVHPPLEARHFFSDANQRLVTSVLRIHDDPATSAGPIDSIALVDALKASGELERAGGARACVGPRSMNETQQREAVSAARLVWELAQRRDVALHCQQALATIYTGEIESQRAFFDAFETRTIDLCRTASRAPETTSARAGFEQFLTSALDDKRVTSISSGFASYDAAVGDLPLGEYTVVGAASGQGKTTWGLNVATNVALHGNGVLYVSTEMLARDLMMLAACAFAATPAIAVRRRNLTPSQQGRLIATAQRFRDMPIEIDDGGGRFGQSFATIRSQARRVASQLERVGKKLRLIVVDYFQDVKLPSLARTSTKEEALCDLSRQLCDLSKEMNVHVMALSQLNDNARLRTSGDRKPDVEDLKGAKGIRFPAQVVMFLHREKTKEGKYEPRGPVELWIRKARFAPTDPVILTWDAVLGRFEEPTDGNAG